MTAAATLERIPGFESTDYALWHGRIVWAGQQSQTDHPRQLTSPWRAVPAHYEPQALRAGAMLAWQVLEATAKPGLLAWLGGKQPPFPLNLALSRLRDLATALHGHHLPAFEAACLRLLGLGAGLTPSGDDLVGAVFFTLHHAPITSWQSPIAGVRARIRKAAQSATNPISAALLDDLLDGSSYRALHELFDALHGQQTHDIERSIDALLRVGASSGGDMLTGVLLTLLNPDLPVNRL